MLKFSQKRGAQRALGVVLLCTISLLTRAVASEQPLSISVDEIHQEKVSVRGTIFDDKGEALLGATIINKRTAEGTISDEEGRFNLSNSEIGDILIVNYIGFMEQSIVLKNSQPIVIYLQEEAKLLNEVVVTGMSISREKKSLGYSSQQVSTEDLTNVRQTSVTGALVGKVAGVRFLTPAGSGFGDPSVVLRGTQSLALGSIRGQSPVFVVDGIITSQSSVNMDDVESINVLKGPAATALYGSRGGNGAIIITTKSGKAGHQEFSVTHSTMFERVYQHADIQSEYGGGTLGAGDGNASLLQYKFDAAKHNPKYAALDGANYYDMFSADQSWGPRFNPATQYAPWYAWDPQDPRFGQLAPWTAASDNDVANGLRTGMTNSTNVSFSKGGKDGFTSISISNVDRLGMNLNSRNVKRFFSIKTSYKLFNRLTVSADYKFTQRNTHNSGGSGFLGGYATGFPRNVSIAELQDYKRGDGTHNSYKIKNPAIAGDYVIDALNPYATMFEVNGDAITQWNVMRLVAKYDLTSKMNLSLIYNRDTYNSSSKNTTPRGLYGSTASFGTSQSYSFDNQYQGRLTFMDQYFNNRMKWDVNLFAELRDYSYEELNASTVGGLLVDKLYNLSGSVDKPSASNSTMKFQEKSLFGTSTLSLDDTYYAEFTLRNDWSSTLPKSKPSYLYGGASLSYIASNHIKADWLTFLKLRASAAQVGSSLSPYQLSEVYGLAKYGELNIMSQPSSYIDERLKPTISTSYEAGTEFALFNGRLSGDLNLYIRDSKNQVIKLPVSHQSGYSDILTNAGLIRNSGVEITLGADIIRNKNLVWTVSTNFAKNVNKLVELNPEDDTFREYQQNYASYTSTFVVQWAEIGSPIGVIRGTDFQREDGKILLRKRNPANQEAIDKHGEYEVVLNRSEKNYLGNSQPLAVGGFSTRLTYKNFTLAGTLDYQIGGMVASVTNMFGEARGMLSSTVGKNSLGGDVRDQFKNNGGVDIEGVIQEGVNASGEPIYQPVKTRMGAHYYYNLKSQVWGPNMYDASYIKLRELSLAYDVPKSTVHALCNSLSSLRLSLIAINPLLIYSAVPNVDVSDTAGGGRNGFFEGGSLLSSRTFGFTVNLTF